MRAFEKRIYQTLIPYFYKTEAQWGGGSYAQKPMILYFPAPWQLITRLRADTTAHPEVGLRITSILHFRAPIIEMAIRQTFFHTLMPYRREHY